MHLRLRPVTEADLPILQAWFTDPLLASRLSRPDEAWLRHVGGPRSGCWIAEEAGAAAPRSTPVGFVQVDRSVDGYGHLAFAINPCRRGAGLGQATLRAFVQTHRGHFRGLKAAVEPDNLASLRCLQRCGFIAAGRYDADGCLVLNWSNRQSD